MYTKLPALSEQQIEDLIKLRQELDMVPSRGVRLRVGANILTKQSLYTNSRWFSWNRHQRALYKSILPEKIISRAIQCWFLEFKPDFGFLDTMVYWVDKPQAGTVIAYALQDGMSIELEGKTVTVPKGTAIAFSLSTVHQVNKSKVGGLWACAMIRACHTTCQPDPA